MDYRELKKAFEKLADSGYNAHVIKRYIIPGIKENALNKCVIDFCKSLEKFNSGGSYRPKYSKGLIPEKSDVQQAIEETLKVYNECISNDVFQSRKSPSM